MLNWLTMAHSWETVIVHYTWKLCIIFSISFHVRTNLVSVTIWQCMRAINTYTNEFSYMHLKNMWVCFPWCYQCSYRMRTAWVWKSSTCFCTLHENIARCRHCESSLILNVNRDYRKWLSFKSVIVNASNVVMKASQTRWQPSWWRSIATICCASQRRHESEISPRIFWTSQERFWVFLCAEDAS